MTIKDEICPRIKADARLMGDGTLWIKTDKLDKVGRVLVEHGTRCKQFYQDAQPEPCEDTVSRETLVNFIKNASVWVTYKKGDSEDEAEFVENIIKQTKQAIISMIELELPPVTPKQKWIPVTEGLPKELDVVLMTVYRTDKRYNQYPYFRIGYIQSGEWYPVPQTQPPFESSLSRHDGGDPVVTAWMPLPQPYKGKE